jgi:hypothetical protein
MDILNFISWIKGSKLVPTVDPQKTLIPLGVKTNTRDDDYVSVTMTVQNFTTQVAATIPAGAQGPMGPQGVPGPVGPAGLNWQGAWSAAGTYVVDDAVGYNGASWFCINNVGPSPINPQADPTNWALLASQGATGPQGPQGIQGPAGTGTSYAFSQVNNTPQYAFPAGISYVVDYVTIPANTFNSSTKAVLELTGLVCKIGTNGLFTVEVYITNTPPVINQPTVTGTKLGGAITTAVTQRTQKVEREIAVNGNSVYYFNIPNTNDSNSDSAVLAGSSNYSATIFNTVLSSTSISWTQNVYITLVVNAASPADLFGARYVTISKT